MTVKKKGLLALLYCLAFLSTCVKATEELGLAWMKGVPLQGTSMAAAVGDASGCTFVAGDTAGDWGQGIPTPGQRDGYLRKYSPDGDLMWVYRLATEHRDSVSCLTLDAQGNCYVGGQTDGSLAPTLIQDARDTQQDAFLAKVSSEGRCLWIRQFGSMGADGACRIQLDQKGNCYVAGNTSGCIDGAAEERKGQFPFVAKFDSTGQLVWINQVRDSHAQTGLGVGVDANGTVALAGAPGYLATFDANGILIETWPLEHQSLRLIDACVDDLGHVYLAGEMGWWARVIQYDLKGQETWSRRFRKNGWSVAKSMVLCPDGSHDMVTAGCQGGPSGGRSCQAFLRRYAQSGELVSIFASPEGYCGAKAGADGLQGAYAVSVLQSNHSIPFIFKAQSPLAIAASGFQP
jgi:hypothetical protein